MHHLVALVGSVVAPSSLLSGALNLQAPKAPSLCFPILSARPTSQGFLVHWVYSYMWMFHHVTPPGTGAAEDNVKLGCTPRAGICVFFKGRCSVPQGHKYMLRTVVKVVQMVGKDGRMQICRKA
ncbi:hypothetical protein EI94DRAFT_1706457 [Lactarius quietus]|nr:hypothetical protein EI94DRAFT_1706457 [Lactarius quietus]